MLLGLTVSGGEGLRWAAPSCCSEPGQRTAARTNEADILPVPAPRGVSDQNLVTSATLHRHAVHSLEAVSTFSF